MTVDTNSDLRERIAERLFLVRDQISEAAKAAGRDTNDITLIGVSKYFPPEYARTAVELGLIDLGENRVQELLEKSDYLASYNLHPRWHLIGTLQSRKVRSVVGRSELIHSVDSTKRIEEIDEASSSIRFCSDILLQVNVSGEESKHGFSPDDVSRAVEAAAGLENIRLRGLMTMAPIRTEETDPYDVFRKTKDLFDRITTAYPSCADFNILSMGMSQDYIDAIQCGATHIRIGTAIFGHRD